MANDWSTVRDLVKEIVEKELAAHDSWRHRLSDLRTVLGRNGWLGYPPWLLFKVKMACILSLELQMKAARSILAIK